MKRIAVAAVLLVAVASSVAWSLNSQIQADQQWGAEDAKIQQEIEEQNRDKHLPYVERLRREESLKSGPAI